MFSNWNSWVRGEIIDVLGVWVGVSELVDATILILSFQSGSVFKFREMLSENWNLYSNIVAAISTHNIKLALDMNQKMNQKIVPIALVIYRRFLLLILRLPVTFQAVNNFT
ncbi:MAG: hypothetical protein HC786_16370 [Richelia sp. CSU_2_1]|nr:hypothetical protein [Microcoleus sp. SU_5_3]NJR23617.1 hypothetical protein [Richelia sp. CSU_2_1]